MDEKVLKIVIHASTWFAPVLAPLIIYFISTDSHMKRLSLQAIVFHFVLWGAGFVSGLLTFILIGFPMLFVLAIIGVWVPVKGIIKALSDEDYQYPIVKNFV